MCTMSTQCAVFFDLVEPYGNREPCGSHRVAVFQPCSDLPALSRVPAFQPSAVFRPLPALICVATVSRVATTVWRPSVSRVAT